MKYFRVAVRMSMYTVRFTVLATGQEDAIIKANDRARICHETLSNKIEATHCETEWVIAD